MESLSKREGRVTLVGAGPGDPDLITVKGLTALREAEVVLYDRLVAIELLDEAPSEAERIFVGKRGGHYSFPQEQIHELMRDRAERGLRVVRLKGGDPFLFGRGSEELDFLRKSAIRAEIVPGVSSALAVPASLGIPVTHRRIASSVTLVSGHQVDDPSNPVDWRSLAAVADTLVVLMPLKHLRKLLSRLLAFGRSLETPACVIQGGTTRRERAVLGTLKNLAERVEEAGLASPSLLIVGEVVSLSEAWTAQESMSVFSDWCEPLEKTGT